MPQSGGAAVDSTLPAHKAPLDSTNLASKIDNVASSKGLPNMAAPSYAFGYFPIGLAIVILGGVIFILRRRRLANRALVEKTNV